MHVKIRARIIALTLNNTKQLNSLVAIRAIQIGILPFLFYVKIPAYLDKTPMLQITKILGVSYFQIFDTFL